MHVIVVVLAIIFLISLFFILLMGEGKIEINPLTLGGGLVLVVLIGWLSAASFTPRKVAAVQLYPISEVKLADGGVIQVAVLPGDQGEQVIVNCNQLLGKTAPPGSKLQVTRFSPMRLGINFDTQQPMTFDFVSE